jgi:hypothetical protein
MMNRLQAAGVGVGVLADWLGDDCTPVPLDQANKRAQACIRGDGGKRCPFNQPGSWWDRVAAGTAQVILAQRRAKYELNLIVEEEHVLSFCSICHCHLPTKILVPMAHIVSRTPAKVWSELPSWCWMKAEKPK